MLFCYLLSFLLLFTQSSFANWGAGDDDEECVSEYAEKPTSICYGGLKLLCHWGCMYVFDCVEDVVILDDDYYDSDNINRKLEETIKREFFHAYPVCFDWSWNHQLLDVWEKDSCEWRVFDWEKTGGFYLNPNNEPMQTHELGDYQHYLDLAAALRRDLRFYKVDVWKKQLDLYKKALPKLEKESTERKLSKAYFTSTGELIIIDQYASHRRAERISEVLQNVKNEIRKLEEQAEDQLQRYEESQVRVENTLKEIDDVYKSIFLWCLKNHQNEGIAFYAALEDFLEGDYEKAIEKIRFLFEVAKTQHFEKEFLAKLHLLKGQIQSEYGLYAEAIIALTQAIHKNPKLKEAYFERAAAYFELGNFDLAIQDYLRSGVQPNWVQHPTQLSIGLVAGVLIGSGNSVIDFVPAMLGTINGLECALWALAKEPAKVSHEFLDAALICIDQIKKHTPSELVQEMVPELKELLQNDDLGDFQKGSLIGQVIGKYGVDILLAKKGASAIKAFLDLKKANRALTLEALASPEKTQILCAEVAKRLSIREQILKNGNLKIHAGRQAKHQADHINFLQEIKKGEKLSVFEHPDPQGLLQKFAGTGIKEGGYPPGMPGYKEIVNFKEPIGYSVNTSTNKKIATTWGKIHYSKDGAHIVPYYGSLSKSP